VVEGGEALRVDCLFFGIRQPQRIKGEITKRPLAEILQDMTSFPLKDPSKFSLLDLPWPVLKERIS